MCRGYCAAEDSMGNCEFIDNGVWEEGDDRPTGCDKDGLCMDCRNLEDCDEFDEEEEEDDECDGDCPCEDPCDEGAMLPPKEVKWPSWAKTMT